MQRIPISSGPLAVGVVDANLDGRPDLVLPSSRSSGQFQIALNRPDAAQGPTFELQTLPMSDAPADLRIVRSTKGLGLHDFDADGRMDIYLANRDGGGPSLGPDGQIRQPRGMASSVNSAHRSLEDNTLIARVLRNESRPGGMRFTDITTSAGLDFLNAKQVPGYPLTQRTPNLAACAPIDFDNDGHLDLVFVHGVPDGSGKAAIYRNTSTANSHWLQINVTAPGKPFGLESKVIVFKRGAREVLGYDEVRTDFCYRSKKSPTLRFGLGSVTSVDILVTTRIGQRRTFAGLPADRAHVLNMKS
jgi:hypothetical protein